MHKISSVAPTTVDFPDPQQHIAATVAYHAAKGHLIPAPSLEPPWRDPEADVEIRLARLTAHDPDCVNWSLRDLGDAIDRSHTWVHKSKWYADVRAAGAAQRLELERKAEFGD